MSCSSNHPCGRCEYPPEHPSTYGRLFLWFPLGHTFTKLVATIRRLGMPHEVREDAQCLIVPLESPFQIATLCGGMREGLTTEELRGTRVLRVDGNGEPTVADFGRVSSLHQFIMSISSDWLRTMLEESRLVTYFQPIVDTEATTSVFAHEALLRGVDSDGHPVPPSRLFATARDADLLFQLDLAARRSAIAAACRHGLATNLFINFTPTAIYDPDCCLRSTVRAIQDAGFTSEQVVFEVIESDRTTDVDHLVNILSYCRKHGFRVALDDVGAGCSSLNMVHQVRPDFIKLDMELIRDVDDDAYKATMAGKLLEIARELNIRTIAEGIETPGELAWCRRAGVHYVQGYLIGRPAAEPVTRLRARAA